MKPRPLLTAAALTLTATLLTACGADQSTTDDTPIAGADQSPTPTTESDTSTPTPSPENAPDGVDLSLPDDVNLLFEWDTPEDENEAAALEDAANYIRAIYRGVSRGTSDDAAVVTYAIDHGLEYARTQIDIRTSDGYTATGTRQHYQATTRSDPSSEVVEVSFCSDSSIFYGKEVKTEKVHKTEPSIGDYDFYRIAMIKHPADESLWRAAEVFVESEAEQCR
ncbi:hypothetical protein AAH978_16755 [Streptomyces sp. ZYX-F-203]